MTFKYIELFAGIGGFRSALDALGGECVLASEIDPFATRAYRALYDGAPELRGDVTVIDADDISDHDLLVGGFPCQSFSVAGKRGGFADTRGTLFFEIARIASAKRPQLLLLENVKGLLSHDGGQTFETMCVVLNDIGYAIDFNVLNSKHFGVPQNRERIFIVASRDAEHSNWAISGTGVVAKAKRRAAAIGIRTFNFDWPANDTVTTRLRDILEPLVDERYYLSDAKTATLLAQLGDKQPTVSIDLKGVYDGSTRGGVYKSDYVGALDHNCNVAVVEDGIEIVGRLAEINGHDLCKRVYGADGIAPTIPTGTSGNTIPTGTSGNTIPKIAVQLQQYSDGSGLAYTVDANYAKGTSPGDIGKGRRTHIVESVALTERRTEEAKVIRRETRSMGRDFSPRRGKLIVPREDGMANCLTSTQTIEQMLLERPRYRIRKLTPLECFRLQAFTDEQHAKIVAAGISDSQRYKMAGNAVTVSVIRAIGEPLVKLLVSQTEVVAC